MSPLKTESNSFGSGVSFGRRGFLKGLGLGAAATGCQQLPVKYSMPYLIPPEEILPGKSINYASTCTACSSGCGLMVTVRDGRPIKLEGNPDHPSGGGLCSIGQAQLRELYDASRLKKPTIGGQAADWASLDAEVRKGLAAAKAAGKEVVVLSPTITGPAARRVVLQFLANFEGGLVEYDPGPSGRSAALEAWNLVDGRPLLPSLDIVATDVLVCMGADPLGTGPQPVMHTRQYANRRRLAKRRGAIRHIQIEGSMSLTGANADERWRASAAEQRIVALHLLAAVADKAGQGAKVRTALSGLPPAPDPARVKALAEELWTARGRSLVLSGADDQGEQTAVALTNQLLGNIGKTLNTEQPSLARRGSDSALLALERKLFDGQVGAIILLGADPVAQLPDGAGWARALTSNPLAVAVTDRPTLTSAACRVVAASHHSLEAWGDAMPQPGVLTIAQPTASPLLDTRHPSSHLLHWSGAKITDYRLFLKAFWQQNVLPDTAELTWKRAVAVGRGPANTRAALPPRSPKPWDAVAKVLGAAAKSGMPVGDGFEVALIEEVARGNGDHAGNPWLAELPDPVTRVAWTPCVRISPTAASRLAMQDGDVLQVTVGNADLSLPVRIVPGQHDRVLGIAVGYEEHNAYALARAGAGQIRWTGLAATATSTGEQRPLAAVQTHLRHENRPIIHQVSGPDDHVPDAHHIHYDLWDKVNKPSPHWEMVIDLDTCTGCGACAVACQSENNIPVVGEDEVRRHRDMHWLRIDRYFQGDGDDVDVLFEPMLCQQCDHAPCETVCPVLATMHSSDGLNQQVYNRCVGTRYCANNCPYKMRRFNWFDYERGDAFERLALNPDVVVRERGVMEKCTFCVQRIQAARIKASADGTEGPLQVQTACQQTCPAQAIAFGDGADDKGEIANLRKSPRAFQVLGDLGVQPSITYLARIRNKGNASEGTKA